MMCCPVQDAMPEQRCTHHGKYITPPLPKMKEAMVSGSTYLNVRQRALHKVVRIRIRHDGNAGVKVCKEKPRGSQWVSNDTINNANKETTHRNTEDTFKM